MLTIAISVRTNLLRLSGVVIRLTGGRTVVHSDTAVTVLIVLGTSRIARVEQGSLNSIVRVWVDAIPRLRWRSEL